MTYWTMAGVLVLSGVAACGGNSGSNDGGDAAADHAALVDAAADAVSEPSDAPSEAGDAPGDRGDAAWPACPTLLANVNVPGYQDSVFVTPDGADLYFLYSPANAYDLITGNTNLQPAGTPLPGHTGADGTRWWNTDLYVSHRGADGCWGAPANLGPVVNSLGMECCVTVTSGGTRLFFGRDSGDPATSGALVSARLSDGTWDVPARIDAISAGETIGLDTHLAPDGVLWFTSTRAGGMGRFDVWYAPGDGSGTQWGTPVNAGANLNSPDEDTQPWISADGGKMYFNRRDAAGHTRLMRALRGADGAFGLAEEVPLANVADPAGATVWGEPTLPADESEMYLVRFDTSTPGWEASILRAVPDATTGGFRVVAP